MLSLRQQASKSFYFFQKGIWGDKDLDERFHRELCDFLQFDPHKRKALVGFRGCLKSSTLRAFAAWLGLHCIEWWDFDWTWLWVEQKWDNAVKHHRMLQNKFRIGDQAQLLCDLYQDRIPTNFLGWTDSDTVLERKDATSENFLSIGSLDSKLEGLHRYGLIGDDWEGADADKSDVPNEDAARFLAERAPYLFKNPKLMLFLYGGTPHGPEPLVWKIREMEAGGSLDNSKRQVWALWWKPIVDEDGKPQWADRYDADYIAEQNALARISVAAKRGVETQLYLRKFVGGGAQFDIERLERNIWRPGYATTPYGRKFLYQYPGETYTVSRKGIIERTPKPCQIDPAHCRFSLHFDPAHKEKEQRVTKLSEYKPSKHAITVVAYTPDCHALLVEAWKAEAPINVALEKFFELYRTYVPWVWTYDPVGAQSWIIGHLETLERHKYPNLTSLPTLWRPKPRRIARPSSTAEPQDKQNRNKEEEIVAQLELPINEDWFHLCATGQDEVWHELRIFGRAEDTFDLLDSLAQGPPVWKPAPSQAAMQAMAKRLLLRRLQEERELYTPPWAVRLPQMSSAAMVADTLPPERRI